MWMEIGEKIKKIRRENGLSQEQFADIFHVTRQAVSNWENGKNYPDMGTLSNISARFGIPLDDLVKSETDASDTETSEADAEDVSGDAGKPQNETKKRKWLYAIIAIALLGAFLFFGVPWIVKAIYYDPDEVVYSREGTKDGNLFYEEESRMTTDLTVYSNLYMPADIINYISGNYRGMGRYDFSMQVVGLDENKHDDIVACTIERNHLRIYDPGVFSDTGSFLWNVDSDKDIRKSLKENLEEKNSGRFDLEEYIEELCAFPELEDGQYYRAIISLDKIMDYPDAVKWIRKYEDTIEEPWIGVATADQVQHDPMGFYIWSDRDGIVFDKEKYPFLAGYEDLDTAYNYRLYDENSAQQHFISMLQYMKDQKVFREMLDENSDYIPAMPYDEDIDEYISFIEENGIKVYGIALTADKDTLLRIFSDPAVCHAAVRRVYR